MNQRIWKTPYEPPVVPAALLHAGYPPLLAAVLAARGMKTPAEADAFLHTGPEALHDPFALRGMDRAVARIRAAMERGEPIAVFGDYDVDGITSTCLLTD